MVRILWVTYRTTLLQSVEQVTTTLKQKQLSVNPEALQLSPGCLVNSSAQQMRQACDSACDTGYHSSSMLVATDNAVGLWALICAHLRSKQAAELH